MSSNVLLISESKLRESTPINANVDSSELRFSISQAQYLFLQETLGTYMFDTMLNLVETGDINLPAKIKYKELLDNQITQMLIAYSYYLALDNFFMKFVNVGLQSFSSEQSAPIDFKTFQYMKNLARDNAQFADNLLRRWLVFHTYDFPEYATIRSNGDLTAEFAGAFKSPITLPGGGNIRGNVDWYDCPYPWYYGQVPKKS
jgi:hypothetical protein